ncbi:exodeoxyribonuclease V subunit alpha, partial [Mycobacterium avium subsp. avium 11-4751]
MTADVLPERVFDAGPLRPFADAGIFEAADIRVAQRLTALTGESDDRVALAVALLVRALRGGSVCVDLRAVPAQVGAADLPWPAAGDWLAAVRASPLLGPPPVLRFFGDLLYFDRYWLEEEQVCTDLLALSAPAGDVESSCYERLFPPGYEEQRAAARIAVSQALTVLTGGPGTGKTTTVARLLALLVEQAERAGEPRPRIALAAPTGKAAARLAEAVAAEIEHLDPADRARLAGLTGTTLHRLLGPRPDTSVRFKHNRGNRLPHDIIVVDETSMVSLTMMARLAEAVRPDTRLILVGDPDQLASVEAGAVLADLVDGLAGRAGVR